jgi:N-methylhydantoinase B
VSARQVVGQMLPDLLFGCLHQVVSGGAPAEGAASLWSVPLFGGPGIGADGGDARPGTPFTVMGIVAGGTGARPRQDGLSATAFPSRVRGIPIEILETLAPVVFWTKELRPDSGGAGTHRGGLGQIVEIGCLEDAAFAMSPGTCDRILYPARGRAGGNAGGSGWIGLASGRRFEDKFRHMVPPGERLVMLLPGGGGYGPPAQRAPAALARDVAYGFVSPAAALHDYGFVPDDHAGTRHEETS